jgi:hypothetical protein
MTFRPLLLVAILSACQDYGLVDVGDNVDAPSGLPPMVAVQLDLEPPEVVPDTDVPEDTVPDDPVPTAQAPVYAHTRDTLFQVDPTTGDATPLGMFLQSGAGIDGMVDIAIDQTGRMFGGTQGSANGNGRAVWRIDPTNGAVTHVCDIELMMYALTFLPDGRLVAGDAGTLQAIDVDHGCVTTLIAASTEWETSGDVVALPDGLIYWTVRGSAWDVDEDILVVVDPASGLSRIQGPIISGDLGFDRLYGLGYDQTEDALYGFSADGEIIKINPFNGAPTLLEMSEDTAWWGATTNPVVW